MHALWKLGRESFWSWNAFCFSYALQLFTSMPLSCDVCLQSSQIGAFEVKFSLTNELQNCSWFNIWDWNFKDVQIGPMVWFLSILSVRVNKLSLSWVVIYLRLDRKKKKEKQVGVMDFYSLKFSQGSAFFELLTNDLQACKRCTLIWEFIWVIIVFYFTGYYCQRTILLHQLQLYWSDKQLKPFLA